jgi:hypothetical protein
MEYGEYWILEAAVECYIPFRLVDGPRQHLEQRFYKPWHHLDRKGLLDVFTSLIAARDITVHDWDGDDFTELNISREELNREFDQPAAKIGRVYGLTAKGGARWERFAEADWNRYYQWETDPENEDYLEVSASTQETAERAFWYVLREHLYRAEPGMITRRPVSPWEATYWKTLDHGFMVRTKCQEFSDYEEAWSHFERGMSDSEINAERARVHSEYLFFHHWYKPHPNMPELGPLGL